MASSFPGIENVKQDMAGSLSEPPLILAPTYVCSMDLMALLMRGEHVTPSSMSQRGSMQTSTATAILTLHLILTLTLM